MTNSGRLTSKARDLGQLLVFASLGPALLLACVYFAPDTMWGRPVSIEVVLAGCMTTVGGPVMTMMLYHVLIWFTRLAASGTAHLPKGELLLYRGLSIAFGGAPMCLGLFTLMAWAKDGGEAPGNWLYFFCGLQLLAFALGLVTVVVFSRRRQRNTLGQST